MIRTRRDPHPTPLLTCFPRKHKHSYKGLCLLSPTFTTLFCSPAISDPSLLTMMENPSLKAGKAPKGEPSFLCTFCWNPQYPPARPKTIGVYSRIACKMCWKSILDLSICWMCGEIIVRGEEVVSLGWCFWHRGCFSCLICGYKLDPPTKERDNEGIIAKYCCCGDRGCGDRRCGFRLRPDEDFTFMDRAGLGEAQRRRGVELEFAPLCGWCETATAGCEQSEIYWHGDQNIVSSDGGLSRVRYWKWREHVYQHYKKRRREKWRRMFKRSKLQQKPKVLVKERKDVSCQEHDLGCRAILLNGSEDLAIGEDGHIDGAPNCSSPADSESSAPGQIYLSVMDPIGEPSFRASRTKPLPRWMTLQPERREQQLGQNRHICPSQSPTSSSGLTPIGEEQFSERHAFLNTSTAMVVMPRLREFEDSMEVALEYDEKISTSSQSVALEKPDFGVSSRINLPYYQESRPQRSGTPYPFERAVHQPTLTLTIPRYSPPGQSSKKSMPAVLRPGNALKGNAASPALSEQEEFLTDGLKVKYTEEVEETQCGKDAQSSVQDEYINRRNELRKELLSLFNDRRRSSQDE